MNKKMLILIVSCFLLWGLSSQAVNPQGVKFEKEGTPFKDILTLSAKTGKSIMIDFYTEWCGWCKKLDKDTYSDQKVGEFSTRFINIKVDAEKGEGVELAKKYHVRGYPTVVFVDSTGKEIDRIVGYRPPEKFLEIMRNYYQRVDIYDVIAQQYKENPNDVEVAFKWAKKLQGREKLAEAKAVYSKVIELDPENQKGHTAESHFQLGQIAFFDINDKEVAKQNFSAIIKKFHDYKDIEWAYIRLANVYEAEKDWKEAIAVLEKALNSEITIKRKGQFLYNLSYDYFRVGQYEKSIETLKRIKSKDFPQDAVNSILAKNYFKLGKTAEGIKLLRKNYELVKDDANKLNRLAWTCVLEKVNVDEAIGWAQRAVELSNRKDYILDTLAELYALNENYQKAIELEKEALEKTTNEKYKEEFSEKIQKWEQALKQGEQR